MGKISKGILGGFTGKVGNVVGSFWKGKAVMRSLSGSYHDPRTEAQLQSRARMALLSPFLSRIYTAIAVGFKGKEDGTTFFNEAVKANFTDGIAGTYPNFTIAYSSVEVSDGNLTNLGAVAASDSGSGDIDLTWQDNSGTGTADANDFVYACFYNVEKDVSVSMSVGSRADASYSYTHPTSWQGDTVHVWLFAQNEFDKCSRSQYVGQVTCS
ncbi:MAG: hypothetical protein IJU81_05985 [Bacteroidales bacterium]|nr:hypothetical protein [Bacteroidales bacterium]